MTASPPRRPRSPARRRPWSRPWCPACSAGGSPHPPAPRSTAPWAVAGGLEHAGTSARGERLEAGGIGSPPRCSRAAWAPGTAVNPMLTIAALAWADGACRAIGLSRQRISERCSPTQSCLAARRTGRMPPTLERRDAGLVERIERIRADAGHGRRPSAISACNCSIFPVEGKPRLLGGTQGQAIAMIEAGLDRETASHDLRLDDGDTRYFAVRSRGERRAACG